MKQAPVDYPAHRVADVVLMDGSTLRIRPVLPEDLVAVHEFFGRQSRESIRLRFHGIRRIHSEDARHLVEVDYRDTFGLVGESSAPLNPKIVAIANYVRTGEGVAEFGVEVDDSYQGRGVGSLILEHLAEAAVEAGINRFEADVLGGNTKMMQVVRSSALPMDAKASAGVIHLAFPTSPNPEAVEAFERREAIAAASGVRAFLEPSSVAVIGASRDRGTIGGEVFHNLLASNFQGPVYPVNPKAEVIQSVKAFASVSAIPDAVDLAVIVVPAPVVPQVVNECGEKGVRALLIISAGFAEVGQEGRALQQAVLDRARAYGMRIIGPNCMGIMNLDPDVRLNASFAPSVPRRGNLAFSSQSGALGIAVIQEAIELGLGLSSFVSVGNKADISGNDLLQYWEQDDATEVILLYLESFGNPRKFARLSRRIGKSKPIVAVKSGRSSAGARAAASHTGSLAAGDIAVDALFKQAGVIRTDTLEELFDVAALLAGQPLPGGNRVAVLTNAGGLGILAADACESAGLELPELSKKTRGSLRSFLPAEASVENPVDMIASATAGHYGKALETIAADPSVDSIVVIFIPPLVTRAEEVADALAESSASCAKTLLTCFVGVRGIHGRLRVGGRFIPSFRFPEAAARALGRAASYAKWRREPEGSEPSFEGIDREGALTIVADLLAKSVEWLPASSVSDLLGCYGVPLIETRLAGSVDEAGAVAEEIGKPVALKIHSQTILHKSDVGGVRLGIDPAGVRAVAREMIDRLKLQGLEDQVDGFVVQPMLEDEGAEMFVGVTNDPLFGPLVAVGAGGTLVELIRDVSVRITPLTDTDAEQMIHALRTFPILKGYRGSPELDIHALETLLLRVSALVEDVPQVAELDLNPVVVRPKGNGCLAIDARIRLAAARPPTPRGARTRPPA